MRFQLVCCVAIAATVSGCASRADSVAPVAISANEYSTLNCADSRAAREVANQKVFALTQKQNNAATSDAAAVFLVGVPLGSVFGGNVAGELAEAKGEALALDRHTGMVCDAEAKRQAAIPMTPTDARAH